MLKSNFFISFSIWDMLSRKAMTLLNMDLEKKNFHYLLVLLIWAIFFLSLKGILTCVLFNEFISFRTIGVLLFELSAVFCIAPGLH